MSGQYLHYFDNYPPNSAFHRDLAYRLISDRIFGSAQVTEKLRGGVEDWLTHERTVG